MRQLKLPFFKNAMGSSDGCHTCEYSDKTCTIKHQFHCFHEKYSHSKKQGGCNFYYNLWEPKGRLK